MIETCKPRVPFKAAAAVTLRLPAFALDDQADKLPDSKLSAKIKSGSGVFVAVGVNVAVGVLVIVGVNVAVGVDVGVLVSRGVPVAGGVAVGVCVDVRGPYSTWSKGAPVASPSYALAVRWPLPVMMIAREWPPDQPGRFTIS